MVELKIPRENANDDFVLITKVHTKDGEKVNMGDILFEFETSKAAVEFEANHNGYIINFTLSEGTQIPVDSIVGVISDTPKSIEADADQDSASIISDIDSPAFVSEAAKLLIEKGQKPVKNNRWVTTDDFKQTNIEKVQKTFLGTEKIERFSNENHLTNSYTTVDIDPRKQAEIKSLGTTSPFYNSMLGVSLKLGKRRVSNEFFSNSILDLVVYETSLLLKSSFNDLNACFIGNNKIAKYDKVVAGIALDDVNNLTVASLAVFENLSDLSNQIIEVVIRFEDKKLKSKDLKSTTFTVTDLSHSGVDFVLPLINGPQGFILGITKTGDAYHIFGSFDHRITEGKRFASFLSELKDRISLYALPQLGHTSNKCCNYCLKTIEEEKSLRNRGLLKIDDGVEEKLICRNCYEGW
jgi:pyruvate/2-oxoglutarate dehydrogenase complex dihydrolipoamide acyltransferase (E2) component